MPRSSGIYSLPNGYQAVSGETIRPSQHNPPLEDIADALTGSLPRDGSAPMTGDLNAGSNKITNLEAGTNDGDALRYDQAVKGPATSTDGNVPRYDGTTGDMFDEGFPVTAFAETILDDADAATARTTLELGTAATKDTGTAAGEIALLGADGLATNVTGRSTAQATTSGDTITFTGIPAGVSEVAVTLKGVGLDALEDIIIQLGTAGGISASGYSGNYWSINNGSAGSNPETTGARLRIQSAGQNFSGTLTFRRFETSGDEWVFDGSFGSDDQRNTGAHGEIDLGAELTQLRVITSGSADFDAGAINVSWRM